jgi:hypothetical protein
MCKFLCNINARRASEKGRCSPYCHQPTSGTIKGSNRVQGRRFSSQRPERIWCPHSLLRNGYRCFPRVSRPGREVNHSSPPRVKINNKWCHTIILLYAFMASAGPTFFFFLNFYIRNSYCSENFDRLWDYFRYSA